MLAKYKFQNTALLKSEIILVNFERLRYTSCNIVNVDHNKNKTRKHCPRMRKRDCNPPLKTQGFRNAVFCIPIGVSECCTACKSCFKCSLEFKGIKTS